ncbi:MAG: FkbM family methyltransferase [Caulobacter sp.]|nr:FkbM family methyltransferase [Caulobacter sp.]
MKPDVLEGLRFQGYSPRTMLDVGAHIGTFTQGFLQTFPDCVPTLIEPNPFCQDALAQLPYERLAVAASSEAGKAEMFLTKEWLQSTGSSLYREDTAFFRDEVVIKQEVDKVRLDDVFAGRRFDFVKIDTQGSELDVLMGGQTVLRQADYILVEISLVDYNVGAAKAEQVFAQLAAMGFRAAEVTDFHRLQGVHNGGLLQLDFLFERQVRRPSQNYRYGPLHGHDPLMAYLRDQKAKCPDFSVIDVGAAANPWSGDVLNATFDMGDCAVAPLHFRGNFNDSRSWDEVLRHVAKHGRFSYAICSHTLEDLAYPAMALEMLPRIAEAGYVCVPSRYLESLRPEGPYRGFIHHRWVLDNVGHDLVLTPKIPLVEHLAMAAEPTWPSRPDRFEFQMHWRGAIAFTPMNGDYLGPTRDAVIGMYGQFFDRP